MILLFSLKMTPRQKQHELLMNCMLEKIVTAVMNRLLFIKKQSNLRYAHSDMRFSKITLSYDASTNAE